MTAEQRLAFLSQAQLDEMAAQYAEDKREVELEQEQWLVFSLGEELFSLSMNDLDEIALVRGGIAIPSIKKNVIGLINLRGEPIILIDTKKILNLSITESSHALQRVLVIKDQDGKLNGFLIDAIVKVTELKNWQSHSENQQQQYHSRHIDAITEYQGKGVSRLNTAELLCSINE